MEQTPAQSINQKGISASMLKVIAMAVMLIDHVAAAILARMLLLGIGGTDHSLYVVYVVMRQIGRTAYPIYCYLLLEGLEYTGNRWKYALRLGVFALVSEIPFDLAFKSTWLELGYQNVFFTLTISLLMLIGFKEIEKRDFVPSHKFRNQILKLGLSVLIAAACMTAAYLLRTDYSYRGVFCVWVLYAFRRQKWLQLLTGYLAFVFTLGEVFAFPAFILLAWYRGRKGFSCKYLFYIFYPAHLCIIYIVCVLMKIANIAAL